ncbi:hypothetical protein [Gellertiella hungarica]|uniref:Uncharacterized protein n=1 Tax=Gellertiella hungarica TaxID=1572859 RepID=A0A7W6NMT2_9HYPH|nr:hypothetical protein [Gellertiella hungarica]MBB4066775.1 hypothetical protein [Gellertiella hungarica]
MHERISSHAVLRYMERVMRLPVQEWIGDDDTLPENLKVLRCCQRARLSLHDICNEILHPAVKLVMDSGFANCKVRLDRITYVVKDGHLITVMRENPMKPRRRPREVEMD